MLNNIEQSCPKIDQAIDLLIMAVETIRDNPSADPEINYAHESVAKVIGKVETLLEDVREINHGLRSRAELLKEIADKIETM